MFVVVVESAAHPRGGVHVAGQPVGHRDEILHGVCSNSQFDLDEFDAVVQLQASLLRFGWLGNQVVREADCDIEWFDLEERNAGVDEPLIHVHDDGCVPHILIRGDGWLELELTNSATIIFAVAGLEESTNVVFASRAHRNDAWVVVFELRVVLYFGNSNSFASAVIRDGTCFFEHIVMELGSDRLGVEGLFRDDVPFLLDAFSLCGSREKCTRKNVSTHI